MNDMNCLLVAILVLPAVFAQADATFSYRLRSDENVTIVIEDAAGRRVRNLVGDAPRPSGANTETWDGRDDYGNPLPPGGYRWRGLSHAEEITANWLGAFYSPGSTPWKQHTRPGGWNLRPSGAGGWLSDHAAPWSVFTDDAHVYLGCRLAEAGDAIIQCDLDGRKLWGALWLGLSGADAMCTEGDVLYVAGEGGWMGRRMGVNRFNVKTYSWVGNPREVAGRHVMHDSAFVREDSSHFNGIAGLYLTSNHIVVAFDDQARLSFFDRKSALWDHDEPVENAEALVKSPRRKILRGRCTDADGNLYVCATNAAAQCVDVYAPTGGLLRTIGKPGGRREGKFDPEAMACPVDVAVDARGHVWVCEHSVLPKRVSVWTRDGKLVRDYVGTPFYGGGGSLRKDGKTLFAYYSGMRFRMKDDLGGGDLDAILFDPDAHPELPEKASMPSTVRTFGDRVYLVSDDGPNRRHLFIGEEVGDRLVPRVMLGNEQVDSPDGRRKITTGVWFWQDGVKSVVANVAYGSEWAMRLGPRMEIVLRTADRKSLAILKPDATLKYDIANLEFVPLPPELAGVCSLAMTPAGDAFIINRGGCGDQGSTNNLFGAVSRDGETLWTYPNPYPSNTHNSPIPRAGELRHTLGIEGFSSNGPGGLMLLNGNKGTRYLFTTDGLFVQELFGDMRTHETTQNLPEATPGMVFSRHSLGDECFFGWMGDLDGRPHVVQGKDSLNVCEIRGVGSISPIQGGTLTLAESAKPLSEIPLAERGPARTVKAAGFGLNHAWWKLAEYAFPEKDPVASFAIGWSDGALTLHYDVKDSTPFENLGDAPHTLFHSGDALDFRWEGDPHADPKRTRPAAGDLRFVIAPMGGKTVVMRYVFEDPDAKTAPTEFVSPAGRIAIARIEEVADAKVDVQRRKDGYAARVEIPWRELGEPKGAFQRGLRRADAGVLFGDSTGTRVVRRQHLFDPGGQEVSDIPSEARVNPSAWGFFEF